MTTRPRLRVFTGVLVLLFVQSAAQVREGGQQPEPPKEIYQQTGMEGAITGKITLRGEAPAQLKIDMSGDPKCREANPSPTVEDLIVNDGAVANVFVYIESGEAVDRYRFETPSSEVILYHRACHYIPRVLGIQTGQMFLVLNSDLTIHNTHPHPKLNAEWRLFQPSGGRPIEKTFIRPEMFILFRCDQHPWQRAYVSVLSHPFFSATGEDGQYRIEGVPPGRYRLKVWHEKLKPQEVEVSIRPHEIKSLDITLTTR